MSGAILTIYERLQDRWAGCDWEAEFGPSKLSLKGVTARQAALLARATSGEESNQWREAADYLDQVETDAWTARQAALLAAQKADADLQAEALMHAQRACDLERRYHTQPVWEALLEAIRQVSLKPMRDRQTREQG